MTGDLLNFRFELMLTVCNRIFGLSEVKDKAQDEALSTRIAGLNLLQLSLEHLGLDIGDDSEDPSPDLPLVQSQLKTLVTECGGELKHLEDPDRRTPQSKLEVLIKAHKIIVGVSTRCGSPHIVLTHRKIDSAACLRCQ
jgi:hypothetical protein